MEKKQIIAPLCLMVLASCSSMNIENKTRIPASRLQESNNSADFTSIYDEGEFQRVLHSRNIEQFRIELLKKLNAIEEVYLRSKNAASDFDKQLNVSYQAKESNDQFFSKIIQSGTYSKLLAVREHNLTGQNQLVYFMKRFKEISKDSTKTTVEIEFANDAFNFLGTYYSKSPRHTLVAHYQIALDLSELNFDNDKLNGGIFHTIVTHKPQKDSLLELFKAYQDNYEDQDVLQKIALHSSDLLAVKSPIGDEIKKTAYMIQSGLINDENAREPQSNKITPGTGRDGNITGNTFPRGQWAITFDDGPHADYTNKIASNLKEFDIKSTFFSLSKNVVAYPHITNGLREAGMEIANHSHDHKQLTKLSDAQLDFEILDSTDKITKVTGEKTKYFRCPYGAGTNVPRVRQRIAKEDMIHVFWSVDSLDWQDHNPKTIVERVRKQMAMSKNGGGIILFHDIHPQSVTASREIMKYIHDNKNDSSHPMTGRTIGDIVEDLNK
jgi:peptidoglycan/xylan/chitin deacetylase (PgdA/CDA1 family)